jgi:beta-lactamase class A
MARAEQSFVRPFRRSLRRAAGLLVAALALAPAAGAEDDAVLAAARAVAPAPLLLRAPAPLWDHVDARLQADLLRSLRALGLEPALAQRKLAVALVDVTDLRRPRVAALNGDATFYAASLPKIAILLAAFEKIWSGQLELDDETWTQLVRMIRLSSNEDSTALMHKVGKPFIAEVLLAPRYRLYDPSRGGGLWAGKDYAKQGVWRRDPMHQLSHSATAMQVARFFYLMQSGQLVSASASREMKRILGDTYINHKFVAGLRAAHPGAAIYRKSGTWQHYHADGALVERPDGVAYIAVGLAESPSGGDWLPHIILAMDRLLPAPLPRPFTRSARGGLVPLPPPAGS